MSECIHCGKDHLPMHTDPIAIHEGCLFSYIKELEAQNAQYVAACKQFNQTVEQLEQAQRWIPVEERLPEDGQRVVCIYSGVYDWRVVTFCTGHFGTINEGSQPATHWAELLPLPSPPEGEQV